MHHIIHLVSLTLLVIVSAGCVSTTAQSPQGTVETGSTTQLPVQATTVSTPIQATVSTSESDLPQTIVPTSGHAQSLHDAIVGKWTATSETTNGKIDLTKPKHNLDMEFFSDGSVTVTTSYGAERTGGGSGKGTYQLVDDGQLTIHLPGISGPQGRETNLLNAQVSIEAERLLIQVLEDGKKANLWTLVRGK